MLPVGAGVKVYLAIEPTDMRKSIDGLSIQVSEILSLDPLSGHLFVFRNRRQNQVKVLYWDRNGFCLWQKRLERGVFRWPGRESGDGVWEMGWRELTWLLEGLDVRQTRAHRTLRYERVD